jgi:cation:H+ antiporter
MSAVLLLVGLVLLVAGADLLVRGASRLALGLRISPLFVGLTIVAFGTSAPELAVSVGAALTDRPDIAIGNVVGSNIFNVLLILGLSAMLAPLAVAARLVRIDVPVMIAVSLALAAMTVDGSVDRGDGVVLLASFALYLAYLARSGRDEIVEEVGGAAPETRALSFRPVARDAGLIALGLVLLVVGSRLLVSTASAIAVALGVSELMIGLTIVAAGTSLPELATSVVAAARGERDIAVGNVVGSNIFNILAILGVAAVIAPAGLVASPAAVTFDIPVMLVVALACLPVFFFGGSIARWEGAIFVLYYLAYICYLALDASDHGALPEFRQAMLYFVLPLTLLTLAVVARRKRRTG